MVNVLKDIFSDSVIIDGVIVDIGCPPIGAPDGEAVKSFDESKHPRGQPENAGQFGLGGGDKEAHARRHETFEKLSTADAVEDYAKNGTRAKAFKEWFGDSKVMDEKGEPKETHSAKAVFHGALADFDAFDKGMVGKNALHVGRGFYFAENKEIAESFATSRAFVNGRRVPMSERKQGSIITAFLSIKNPLDLDAPAADDAIEKWAAAADNVAGKDKFERTDFEEGCRSLAAHLKSRGKSLTGYDLWKQATTTVHGNERQVNDVVQALGYDGIVHTAVDVRGAVLPPHQRDEWPDFGRCWVAFEPTQIKAVDNAGTFDSEDPNIRKAMNKE